MLDRRARLRLIHDRHHYDVLIDRALRDAKVAVWIATSNLKEVYVAAPIGTRARARGRYISLLEMLASLAEREVELRLLHGATPSRPFRKALQRFRGLHGGALTIRQCPRVHFKMMAIDGSLLYLGSANLTGAGLGAKGEGRRNFETGLISDDESLLDEMQERFDDIWRGESCGNCRLRRQCPAPLDDKGR